MTNLLTTILLLFTISSFAAAQIESDQTRGELTVYSESATYQPRDFPADLSKPKKEKNSKKNNQTTQNNGLQPAIDDTITIPVSVFDESRNFVKNLKQADFTVFVDGREQKILSVTQNNEPVNLIMLIDTSPSTAFKIDQIKNYAQAIVEQLQAEDKVMVVAFSDRINVLAELTTDHQTIAKAIHKLKFGDGTSLYEAVTDVFEKYVRQINGLKTVVLLTDGVDTTSRRSSYADSLFTVEKTNTSVFPVYFDTFQKDIGKAKNNLQLQSILNTVNNGISPGSTVVEYERGRNYLNDISKLSGGRPRQVRDINNLSAANIGNVGAELRVQYQIRFRPTEFFDGQRKSLVVRINRPNLFVQARGSLIVGNRTEEPR